MKKYNVFAILLLCLASSLNAMEKEKVITKELYKHVLDEDRESNDHLFKKNNPQVKTTSHHFGNTNIFVPSGLTNPAISNYCLSASSLTLMLIMRNTHSVPKDLTKYLVKKIIKLNTNCIPLYQISQTWEGLPKLDSWCCFDLSSLFIIENVMPYPCSVAKTKDRLLYISGVFDSLALYSLGHGRNNNMIKNELCWIRNTVEYCEEDDYVEFQSHGGRYFIRMFCGRKPTQFARPFKPQFFKQTDPNKIIFNNSEGKEECSLTLSQLPDFVKDCTKLRILHLFQKTGIVFAYDNHLFGYDSVVDNDSILDIKNILR